MPRLGAPHGAALLAVALTSVFFINFCNLVFQCGCASLWAGADAHCNIHNSSGRHCPWCAGGPMGQGLIYGAIAVPQIVLAFRPRRWSLTKRFAASLLAFPAIGGILALALGLFTEYWN